MQRSAPHSLRRKVMQVVLATTGMALLISASALLVYEVSMYRQTWVNDLQTQSDILARTTRPALNFDDPPAAAENLAMLRLRPEISAAAIYRSTGALFAEYRRPGVPPVADPAPGLRQGHRFTADQIELFQPIEDDQRTIGFVYLRSQHDLAGRVTDYLLILASVMATSLVVATWVSSHLQRTVTEPLLAVAQVARQVMQRRDFSLRAEKSSQDEVGELVDAFNDMLREVDTQTRALEQSNEQLMVEMAERRKAEQALTEAARTKDAFLATLAHELRNPLAPISTAVEILRRVGDSEPDARRRAVEIMGRQLQQMVRLIDDLLDVSRISTGKLLLKLELIDLVAVLRSAVEIASPLIESRRHRLSTALPDVPQYIHADSVRLAQVFANLLNNAAKYTPPGGELALSLDTDLEGVTVRVQDNGMGIPREMQGAIFDLFVQVDQSLERGTAGLGVGLTLARQLIALHGGTISVHSEGAGQGSQFTVRLPWSQVDGVVTTPPTTIPPMQVQQDSLRIVVADDNRDFAASLGSLLRSMGHVVSVAHDGLQALHLARQEQPDLVLLDIGMPGLNGYELASRLRQHDETRHTLLVAITGWGQAEDRERARTAGLHHLLVKPVRLEDLTPLLRLARRRPREEVDSEPSGT